MKKIAIQTELTDFQEPWGGVYHEGEQQPFPSEVVLKDNQEWGHTREDVERVIKENANGKFGYALVFTDDKFIVTIRFFKNKTDGEKYELDPEEYKDLVLKEISFQGAAPTEEFILDVKVTETPVTSQVAGVDNFFRFTYNSYWGTDPTQLDQAGKAILRVDGYVKEELVLQSANPANSYFFNIGQYIINESQVVNIEIRNGSGKVRYWNFNIYALILKLKFSNSFISGQTIAKDSNWELRLETEGVASTVHVEVDGGAAVYEGPAQGSGSITFMIDPDGELGYGSHTIEAWTFETVYGMQTEHLVANFIKAGVSSNVIVLGNNPPTETMLYDTASIPFFFYAPNASDGDNITVTIVQRDANNQLIKEEQQTVEIINHSSGVRNAVVHIKDSAYVNQNINVTISISGDSVTHSIRINNAAVTLQKPAECKVYYDLNEKTNSDADVVVNDMKSKYNSQVTSHLIYSDNFLQREGVLKEGVGFTGNGGFYIPPGKTLTLEDWQPFAHDFGVNNEDPIYGQKGKAISIEFMTGVCSNNDIPIISCMDNKCGFRVYPNRIDVEHGGSHVYSYFPEGERVSFTLVVDGFTTTCINDDGNGHRTETPRNLAYLYMNGVMVRIFEYSDEHWNQDSIQNIVFGSAEASVTIYSISGWDKNITMKEVIDNFAYDTPLLADKIAVAKRNDILQSDGKTVDVTKLSQALPETPIITWFMEELPSQKGSENEKECKETVFDNPDWDKRSEANAPFTSGEHRIGVDGTSSANYPLPYKNWAEKFNNFTLRLESHEKSVSRYSITYGVPNGEKKFVHKVNFASSEGIFNILAMNMYQALTVETAHTVSDILSLQQQDQADKGYEISFRKSLSGFPEIGLRKHTDKVSQEVKTEFLSIYNFINNKKTGSMFGMEDDYRKNQLWEVDGNRNFFIAPMTEHTIVEGQVVESNGVRKKDPLYYSRVPADSPVNGGDLGMCASITQVNQANDEIRALRDIHNWIVSINPNVAKRYYARYGHYRNLTVAEDGWTSKEYNGIVYTQDTPQYRAQKFDHEYTHHLHLNDCIFYFVFCTYILGTDSMDKNMSLFLDDLEAFYNGNPDAEVKLRIMLRDTDTTNMFNNSGVLAFKYWHEWNDTYNATTGETGQILGETWDGSKYVINSSVPEASPVFNGRLSGLWDAIVQVKANDIRDMYRSMRGAGLTAAKMMEMYKAFHDKWCEALYNVDGIGYANTGELNMAYGDKYLLSKYFYKYRQRYMDSKYGVTGSSPRTSMRFGEKPAGIWMKHATPIYASFDYGVGEPVTARSIVVGEPVLLPCSSVELSGEVCYINDADLVTEIGIYTQINNNISYHGLEGVQKVYFDHGDFVNLVRLRKFIWENTSAAPNTLQTAALDFRNLKNLQELVMTYCTSYEYSPVIGSEIIEKIDFIGTPISSITIPETETLTILRLPSTLTELNLKNLPNLANFSIQGIENLVSVNIENTPLVAEAVALALVTLIENGGTPVLTSGKFTLSSISNTNFWKLYDAFGEEVFDSENELYIEVPAGVYIRDTKPGFEAGQSQTIQAISIPLNEGTTIEYQLIEDGEPVTPVEGIASFNGFSLNVATGLLTSTAGTAAIAIVRTKATTEGVDVYSDELTINANVYTYPEAIGVSGDFWQWEAGNYIYSRTMVGNYNAEIESVDWSLTNSNDVVEMLSKTASACLIRVISVSSTEVEPILTCKVKFKTGHEMTGTLRILIQDIAEQRFVDLQLPTGTLWGTLNLRATSPINPGFYYSFGETTGYARWQDKDSNHGFDVSTYEGQNLANLTDSLDAAFQYSIGEYKMPTRTQCVELLDSENTTKELITLHNVQGYLITSIRNNKRIFIPLINTTFGVGYSRDTFILSRTRANDNRFVTGIVYYNNTFYVNSLDNDNVTTRYNVAYGYQIRPVK